MLDETDALGLYRDKQFHLPKGCRINVHLYMTSDGTGVDFDVVLRGLNSWCATDKDHKIDAGVLVAALSGGVSPAPDDIRMMTDEEISAYIKKEEDEKDK